MEISYHKIKLNEFEAVYRSILKLGSATLPISSMRMLSYLNNPNAQPDDVCMILAKNGDQMIGFRTFWPDVMPKTGERFVWLSGSWVDANFRRQGIASQMLNLILETWNGKIGFSNYAPISEKVYLKSNHFIPLITLEGVRFYRRFCVHFLWKTRRPTLARCLKPIEQLLNTLIIDNATPSDLKGGLDVKVYNSYRPLKDILPQSAFISSQKLLWVSNYPWVTQNKSYLDEEENYPFTLYSKDWVQKFVYFFRENELCGFLIYNIKDGQMKIPYCFAEEGEYENIAQFIAYECEVRKLSYFTVFHPKLKAYLSKMKFLYSKSIIQKFYFSKDLQVPSESLEHIQAGDSDAVFT